MAEEKALTKADARKIVAGLDSRHDDVRPLLAALVESSTLAEEEETKEGGAEETK